MTDDTDYRATLFYRDNYSVEVRLSSQDSVNHLMDRLFSKKQYAIVIDEEKTLFFSPDNLMYAKVTPTLE